MPMTPEVKRAIENIWDHRNIHLGDTRIPCDGEVIKNYIYSQDSEIERLKDGLRKIRLIARAAQFPPSFKSEIEQYDRQSYRLIFGVEFTGELTDEVLKMIYGKYWR
jgi:hypothetical protein